MSSSDESTTYPLTIDAGRSGEFQVFDGSGALIAEGSSGATLQLARGLYQVRVRSGSSVRDELVRHVEGGRIALEPPSYVTPVPLESATNAHADHQHAAAQWSMHATPVSALGVTPSLFVFVRSAGLDGGIGPPPGDTLVLWDPLHANPIHFVDAEVTRSGDGWRALSLDLPPGTYRMEDRRPGGRAMPVSVAQGWCTQVFVWFDGRPKLELTRVFMAAPGIGFRPDGAIEQATDRGLEALQTGSEIPRRELGLLLEEKFANPMQGLLGGHLLLGQERPEPSHVDMVLGNLHGLLPGNADVDALALRASAKLRRPSASPHFSAAPMFRAGFLAAQKWAARQEDLFDEPLLEIADSLLADSPWTQWELDGMRTSDEEAVVRIGKGLTPLDLAVLQRMAIPRSESVDASVIASEVGRSRPAVVRAMSRVSDLAARHGTGTDELLARLVRGE